MSIFDDIRESIENFFNDLTTKYDKSSNWKEYHLGATINHCNVCAQRNYKIYEPNNVPELPEHERCACYLEWLRAIGVGKATTLGNNGADYWLKYFGKLPDYYISKEKAESLGWKKWLGNLDKVAPGKMIGGNRYYNVPPLLPEAPERIWYECDIDYQGGYRNNYRIVYSNDGLIFKTDNHYKRFIAVE